MMEIEWLAPAVQGRASRRGSSNHYPQARKTHDRRGFNRISLKIAHPGPCLVQFRNKVEERNSTKFVDGANGRLPSVKKILELPTPCLLVDLDRFESNLDKMSRHTRECGIALRPHAKTHKCVNIARRQLEKGAIGICVATI